MAAYTILEDATDENAKYRITNDSYDCVHPNNTDTAGVNGVIVQCGLPWYTRWIDYEIYTATARAAVMAALWNTCVWGDTVTVRGLAYYLTGCECTEAVFTDDLAEVKTWKYHMTFVR
jgi:hypothetical protein